LNKKVRIVIILIITFLSLEIVMRVFFGFCDTVLMTESANFEYIAQPNQKRYRFGNNIHYNAFSMRSEPIDTAAVKILGFGDSVINGGVQTDHDALATTLLSSHLSEALDTKVQFLNISAGSWGPDNCYAYLEQYGDWNAEAIFLFVSSHDAFDTMNFEKIVGVNNSFPDKQYKLALYELLDRYLIPRLHRVLKKGEKDKLGINKKTENSPFNSGFDNFYKYSLTKNIPLIIYLHAEKSELKAKKYNQQGQLIIDFANKNNIALILDLNNNLQLSDFRDNIHINSLGQKKIADLISSYYKALNNSTVN